MGMGSLTIGMSSIERIERRSINERLTSLPADLTFPTVGVLIG